MQYIDPSARIGPGCTIGQGVVIEANASIGDGCQIEHHAIIKHGTQVGPQCKIGEGAVLGRDPQPAPTSVNKSPNDLPPLVLGEGCLVGAQAVIYRGVVVGKKCLIADLSFVREATIIGDCVIIGAHVTVENRVRIGSYTKIQTGAYITAATTIEDHVFIAPCVVTTNDNFMGRTVERFKHWGGALIKRGARVGANVTLLPNMEIGEEAFIAAASIVTKSVPDKTVAMGSPARYKRDVPENEWTNGGDRE